MTTTPAAIHHPRRGRLPTHSESSESGRARKSASSHTAAFSEIASPESQGIGDAMRLGSSSSSLGTHQPKSVRVTR